ncbi:MAG: AAA family ATPase [Chloroflexi bacterium]|nr:AAA family ATPase [Chloroflexota bacterium]
MILTVACRPLEEGSQCTALLDPAVMKGQSIAVGDVIEIRSHSGRSTLARTGTPRAEDSGRGTVRLDHYVRRVMKTASGQQVDVRRIAAQAVSKVFLRPLTDAPGQLEPLKSRLQDYLGAQSLALGKGSVVRVVLPDLSGRAVFEIVGVEPGPGVTTADTAFEVVLTTTEPEHGHKHDGGLDSTVTYEDLGGLSSEIKALRELVELPLHCPQAYSYLGINPPRGIILHGPPGVGKTRLVLALASEVNASLFYINGPEIVSSQFGETETNLRKVFQEASHHKPSVILIDELDVIAPKRDQTGSFTTTRTVSQLLSLLDGLKNMDGVVVLGTTNRIDSLDSAVRRPGRFDQEIFLSPPDVAGRKEILNCHSRGMPLSDEASDYLSEIAKKAHGFVGADLMELCRAAGLSALRRKSGGSTGYLDSRDESLLEGLTVEKKDLEHAFSKGRPSALREVSVAAPDIRWNDIGGLPEVKAQLHQLVQMLLFHPESFANTRIKPSSGIILHGPSGVGKTLLAEAIANECQANFIPVKGPEIFSKWLGESEAEIRYIFQLARRVTPSLILLDQIDAMAPCRGKEAGAQALERVVNQLLVEMESIQPPSKVLVVATSNRLDLIDPALLQPRRFGCRIYVPLPDETGRKEILRIYLKNSLLAGETNLDDVVEMVATGTEGFSGGELESVCFWARMLATDNTSFEVSPLRLEHFEKALAQVRGFKMLSGSGG